MNATRHASSSRLLQGYSLIEVMISVVLGLILIASVLTLVVSVLRSNAETVGASRVTQELRTLVEVIGREVERARLMNDPESVVGNPPDPTNVADPGAFNPNGLIDDGEDGCLRFSYATGARNRAVTFAERNGAIFVGVEPNAATEAWTDPDGNARQRTALVDCDDALTRLSSPALSVTDFEVVILDGADTQDNDTGTAGADGWVDCDQPDSILSLTIAAEWEPDGDTTLTRTVTDRIRVGSADLKADPFCFE